MKVFIFRCRTRPQMQAATRYETGSNLPADRCSGGWIFSEYVDLKDSGAAQIGIDLNELRRRLQQQGYHVWEPSGGLHKYVDAEIPPPVPQLATLTDEPPPVSVPEPVKRRSVRAAPAAVTRAPAAAPSPAVAAKAATAAAAPRHQVVWFDIPVRDLDRAIRFYSAVLGTPLKKEPAGRGAAMAILPHPDDSVGGCLMQTMDARPSDGGPLLYLNAQGRLDQAIAAAQANGGTVVQPKHSIGTDGYRAIVLDTEGNRIALHSP